ncbi:hypothetical protein IAT40_004675 [Kwoniella sp. CBS 6097]
MLCRNGRCRLPSKRLTAPTVSLSLKTTSASIIPIQESIISKTSPPTSTLLPSGSRSIYTPARIITPSRNSSCALHSNRFHHAFGLGGPNNDRTSTRTTSISVARSSSNLSRPERLLSSTTRLKSSEGSISSASAAVEEGEYYDAAADEGAAVYDDVHTEERIRLWTSLGITPPLAQRLIENYPHIRYPTPAQKLFALAVGAGKEVFLKDDMGRGKTLALAVVALNRALRSPSRTGVIIMIIVPTPYLAHQIYDHLLRLTPKPDHDTSLSSFEGHQTDPAPLFTLLRPMSSGTVTTTKAPSSLALPDTPMILSTAKDLMQYDLSSNSNSLSGLKYIFIDEPDTLLGPIPPRYYPPQLLSNHPINRHPPPIVHVLNTLLNIRPGRKGEMDFSKRFDTVNTIWTSASMIKDFKRVVKTRGWIKRGNKVVDLDFTDGASDKARDMRERLLTALPSAMRSTGENDNAQFGVSANHQGKIGHYALVIDPSDGNIAPLIPGSTSLPSQPSTSSSDTVTPPLLHQKKVISPYILESLALLHATSPPPPGRYALILPPEGVSLSSMATELSKLGIPTLILAPHLMQIGIDTTALSDLDSDSDVTANSGNAAAEQAVEGTPILLAQRSSIPGLHLKDLHTIYLLDGLDVGGLSQKQRKSGGVRDRFGFYELVAGRLGRLGTASAPLAQSQRRETERHQVPARIEGQPIESSEVVSQHEGKMSDEPEQRVISLVLAGTEEEKRLGEMFLNEEQESALTPENRKKNLSQWDLEGLYSALEKEMGVGSVSEDGEIDAVANGVFETERDQTEA